MKEGRRIEDEEKTEDGCCPAWLLDCIGGFDDSKVMTFVRTGSPSSDKRSINSLNAERIESN